MTKFRSALKKATPRWIWSTLVVLRDNLARERAQYAIDRENRRTLNEILGSGRIIKLELGGLHRKGMEDWVSVDLEPGCDIRIDLTKPLPLSDSSVSAIYSSHLFEHFRYPHPMIDLLGECFRVLREGGIFSIAVPNCAIYLQAYVHPEGFDYRKYCLFDTGLRYKAKIDFVNYMAYMGGHHQHMFDEEGLLAILHDAGFEEVRIRDFDPRMDHEGRRYESLYAEGRKPKD